MLGYIILTVLVGLYSVVKLLSDSTRVIQTHPVQIIIVVFVFLPGILSIIFCLQKKWLLFKSFSTTYLLLEVCYSDMKKLFSNFTYYILFLTFGLAIVALIVTNSSKLPLDAIIAMDAFFAAVIFLIVYLCFRLKRVWLLDQVLLVKDLFSNRSIVIPFDQTIAIKSILPLNLAPLNYHIIFLGSDNKRRKIYFIKSFNLLRHRNLGIELGICRSP